MHPIGRDQTYRLAISSVASRNTARSRPLPARELAASAASSIAPHLHAELNQLIQHSKETATEEFQSSTPNSKSLYTESAILSTLESLEPVIETGKNTRNRKLRMTNLRYLRCSADVRKNACRRAAWNRIATKHFKTASLPKLPHRHQICAPNQSSQLDINYIDLPFSSSASFKQLAPPNQINRPATKLRSTATMNAKKHRELSIAYHGA